MNLHESFQSLLSRHDGLAAGHGQLEVVKYLHANLLSCWTGQVLNWAIQNRHVVLMAWLVALKPSDHVDQKSVRTAVERGHLAVLHKLAPFLSYLVSDSDCLDGLAQSRKFPTLVWGFYCHSWLKT